MRISPRKKSCFLAGGLVFVACSAGCRVADGTGDDNTVRNMTEEEIISLAYDNSYSVPGGFYVDERADTPGSYTVYHVKDASVSYELCSDNVDEAYDLESADNAERAVNGVFVGTHENTRYFEFIRELAYPDGVGNVSDPVSPGFSRVFKCSYLDREGVDRNIRDGYAGVLNVRPLDGRVLQELTEYLWQFTFFWPAKKKVLRSSSSETESEFRQTLLLAFVVNQGTGQCDRIEVVDWTFSAGKSDGVVTKNFQLIHHFEAELANGKPGTCNP